MTIAAGFFDFFDLEVVSEHYFLAIMPLSAIIKFYAMIVQHAIPSFFLQVNAERITVSRIITNYSW
ncbi:hypothetical protein ABF87_01955 [Nitrosomonas sp. JL21]|uniref:hypothetical protein n=1 Tax=Nitrosomonas sp. JL21 TaxID=153949 RepID=UPI0013686E29|nr:hypothetical protein [Nitrosomonas sp. JL21]MBL8497793.1 hypothetical protein [Nitrosomonas sp.]MXS76740.1 hypothetical protein [Nitrosomonas sp. JL21]